MRKAATAAAVAVIVLACAQGASAQRSSRQTDAELRALRQEVETLRQGQLEIQAELRELKELLQQLAEASAPEGPKLVSVDDDPSVGEATARVVLIDFSDYQ